jgi:purine-binding chemotaxis protein CheW
LASIEAGLDHADEDEPAVETRLPDRDHRKTHSVREEYLVFVVSGVELALGLSQIRELIQYVSVVTVPGAQEWIRGVTNIRGQVIPIVDLAKCFGLTPEPVTTRTCNLVLEVEVEGHHTHVCAVADHVRDVIELERGQIEPAPRIGTSIPQDRIRGTARHGDGFLTLLNVERLLPVQSPSAAMPDVQDEGIS